MDVLRTSDDRFTDLPDYPFEPHYLELGRDLAGLRLHYVEEGSGPPILLLHGEPSWSFLYRKMIPPLASHGRVVAPDYIGFGRSDKVTDLDWYTYDRHTDSIAQVIEQLGLEEITLVVQDWGGPIGLRLATEAPDRFARLVILNTGLFRPGPNWPSETWLAFRDFAVDNPDLPIGFLIQSGCATGLQDDVLAGYEAPYPNADSKAGARAFPLLVPTTADAPGAAQMARARDALEAWTKPTLVAFSDSDPIFPVKSGRRWAERIPGSGDLVVIEGAGHFLQEDRGDVVARCIIDFVTSKEPAT